MRYFPWQRLKSRANEIIKQPGYTLIEMALVLALLAFLMMLVLPQSKFSRNMNVRAELETMHTLITSLHYRALATAQDQELFLDPEHHCYSYNKTIHALGSGVTFGFLPGTQGPPSKPLHPVTQPLSFVHQKIICSAQGTLSSGVLYLTDAHKECMYALTIPVGEVAGIKKYRFDNQWVALP
jgi:prepilin-type N-terminal cleavage/methylation domain-containing protein